MNRQKDKPEDKPKTPERAPNGIKVYYPAEDEAYIREQARRNGMTVQQYLKWKTTRERMRRS